MIKNYLITGDTHGRVEERLANLPRGLDPAETAIIILGDAGINFYLNKTDYNKKKRLQTLGYTFYLVRGNHEERPENLPTTEMIWDDTVQGNIYREPEFPNIRYFLDGGTYNIDGLKTLVVGGAYSVDKHYRIKNYMQKDGWCGWFESEQLTEQERSNIVIATANENYDLVLTHTCPYSWMPTDLFLSMVDQSTVDNSMERFLDVLKGNFDWTCWLFGHFHADRLERPGVEMYYTDIEDLKNIRRRWIRKDGPPWWMLKGPNYYYYAEV